MSECVHRKLCPNECPCDYYEEEERMKIKLDPGAYMPLRAHPTDAGLDLRCMEDTMMWPQSEATFDTGVHIELPHGYYGKIESKSGLNVNHSMVSCGGTIDEGYTGSIKVKLYNLGNQDHLFKAGDKIAQLVIMPYIAPELELVENLEETARGDNGFGSTGR
jgi:dUTP pyrophosphatase